MADRMMRPRMGRDPQSVLSLSTFAVAFVAALSLTAPAAADEDAFPRLDWEVDAEIEFQGQVDSDEETTNELLTTTEPFFSLKFSSLFAIESGLVLEPVGELGPGEDRIFGETGLFAETLYAKIGGERAHLFAGKINPTFGLAWDITPGIFGTEPAEEFYEQVEAIGVGGALAFGKEGIGGDRGFGTVVITGQTFFDDTSFLSQSAFTSRGNVSEADGGPGNTEELESFSITIDGHGLPTEGYDLSYHLGVIRNAPGVTETDAEWGFVGGLYGSVPLGLKGYFGDLVLESNIEYVRFQNDDGIDRDQNIVTVGAVLLDGPVNYAIAATRLNSRPDSEDVDDFDFTQVQATAGYAFPIGLDVDVGYKFTSEEDGTEDVDSHFIGLLFHYVIGGSVGG